MWQLASWNDHWKPVHLNLRDTAMAAAHVVQKNTLLVAHLRRRLALIRLTATQAQLFHIKQQQGDG